MAFDGSGIQYSSLGLFLDFLCLTDVVSPLLLDEIVMLSVSTADIKLSLSAINDFILSVVVFASEWMLSASVDIASLVAIAKSSQKALMQFAMTNISEIIILLVVSNLFSSLDAIQCFHNLF